MSRFVMLEVEKVKKNISVSFSQNECILTKKYFWLTNSLKKLKFLTLKV